MNNSVIRYILGNVLKLNAGLLLLPVVVSLLYGEQEGIWYVYVSVGSFLLGALMCRRKPADYIFGLKEGCIVTALSWIALGVVGCIPFILTGEITNPVDALFETVSGLTTTGASVLSDVEALSYTSLFWRSFTHWIGGMGVLVFLLAVVPMSGGSNINLMKAESPGPSVGKLVPKAKQTAKILYEIYIALTVIEIVLLLLGNMPVFDAITLSFGTAGTGGFGIKNDSIMSYTAYQQWVITIFMILFGVNFNAYYFILFRKFKKILTMEEVRTYFAIIASATAVIVWQTYQSFGSVLTALRHALFQVASVMTTTGYSTVDFDQWSATCKTVLVILMFVGACAGSTGGGIKVSRFVIMFKTFIKEIKSYIHPKSIEKINMDGKPLEHDVLRSTNVYFGTFIVLFCISVLAISFENKDFATTFTAVAATINNIGPGLELVGPTQNFGFFSNFSKLVLIFDMLAGRLELFPLLILFTPEAWKEILVKYKKRV